MTLSRQHPGLDTTPEEDRASDRPAGHGAHESSDRLSDPARLAALAATGLMDSDVEPVFDRSVRIASRLLGTPVALLSLVDDDRQFFKSQLGLPEPTASERQTPLSHSFCQHVVATGDPLVVEDARTHPLVRDNLAIRDLNVIAYLGVPIRTLGGHVLGSFCAIEGQPRAWTQEEVDTLRDVAEGAASEINLRIALKEAEAAREEAGRAAAEKDTMFREVNHRVKNLMSLMPVIVKLSARSGAGTPEEVLEGIEARIGALARSHALTLNTFSEDRGVAIDALVRAVLEPYGMRGDAFRVDGPGLRLASGDANTLGLALHELATNAAKYGALAEDRGLVTIEWRLRWESSAPPKELPPSSGPHGDRLVLRWNEMGGPTVPGPPERSGFGTTMIDRIVTLGGGAIERDWRPEGLRATIELKLRRAR